MIEVLPALMTQILVSFNSLIVDPPIVFLQLVSNIEFKIVLFAFIPNMFSLRDVIILLLTSCLGHLTHNRGVPCTDDLPTRQMLLLNSRLSLPSSHVLPQVVRHRPFKNGKCSSLTADCHCPLLMCSLRLFSIARLKTANAPP